RRPSPRPQDVHPGGLKVEAAHPLPLVTRRTGTDSAPLASRAGRTTSNDRRPNAAFLCRPPACERGGIRRSHVVCPTSPSRDADETTGGTVPRPDKVAKVDEVRKDLTGAAATLLTHYRGLSVTEMAE